jgi:putative transposase
VFDHCATGQQLKCLTVTDEFTKEGLAIDVGGRIRSPRVIGRLSRLVSERGAPTLPRSDNGPEFVSKTLLSWIVAQGIGTALSPLSALVTEPVFMLIDIRLLSTGG